MSAQHTMDLTTGPVTKRLLLFTFPLIISNLLQQLYNAADMVVVGQFAGKQALAAVGAAGAPTNMVLNLFFGLAVGANVICANQRGARNQAALDRCMHTSILLAVVGGVVLTVLGEAVARPLLVWMRTPDNVLELSSVYVMIYFLGFPVSMLYNFGAGILRAYGDTRRPMIILLVSGLINIGLNLIFVIVFHMSVAGVALATIISQAVSAAVVLAILFDPKGDFKLRFQCLRFHKKAVGEIVRVGVPCGLNGMIFSVSNVIIQSTINPFGDTVIAGNTAATSISTFVYQVHNSFYNACISFAGQNFGAKKYRRIDKLLVSAILVSVGIITALAVLMTCFPRPLLRLYNSDPEVIAAAIPRLVIVSWGYIIYTVSELTLGCLRGIGKSVIPTALNAVGICVPRIGWCMVIGPLIASTDQLWILYLCFPISWIISSVFMVVYYLICRRKLREPAVQIAQ